MPKHIKIRPGEDEERATKQNRYLAPAGNIEAHQIFSIGTMIRETLVKCTPEAWVDIVRSGNPPTTTSHPELEDLLFEYIILTPFVDEEERGRETFRTASP
jgi:hypothetical protein